MGPFGNFPMTYGVIYGEFPSVIRIIPTPYLFRSIRKAIGDKLDEISASPWYTKLIKPHSKRNKKRVRKARKRRMRRALILTNGYLFGTSYSNARYWEYADSFLKCNHKYPEISPTQKTRTSRKARRKFYGRWRDIVKIIRIFSRFGLFYVDVAIRGGA